MGAVADVRGSVHALAVQHDGDDDVIRAIGGRGGDRLGYLLGGKFRRDHDASAGRHTGAGVHDLSGAGHRHQLLHSILPFPIQTFGDGRPIVCATARTVGRS